MEKKGVSLDRGMLEKLVPLYRERSANLVELAEDMALYQPGADVECEEKAAKSLTDEGKGHIAALRGYLPDWLNLMKLLWKRLSMNMWRRGGSSSSRWDRRCALLLSVAPGDLPYI